MSELSDTTDKRIRALAHLRALKTLLEDANTPAHISQQNIRVLNGALDHLTALGENVEEFRLPDDFGRYMPGIGMLVEKAVLYAKVAAALEYFTIRSAVLETAQDMDEEPARMIGYLTPAR